MTSSSSPIDYPVGVLHSVGRFINLEPITKKGIIHYNPRMIHIYQNKRGKEPVFIAVAANTAGVAIKTLYEKGSTHPDRAPSCYLGKIGSSRGVLANHSGTYRTITKKKINFETMLEKLAYDLYQELGRGLIQVPKTYLSRLPILDAFTKTKFKALVLAGTTQDFVAAGFNPDEALEPEYRLSNESIRIMSRYYNPEEYQDFTSGFTRDFEGKTISFVDFIKRYHRPPTVIQSPNGSFVPLRGFVALLAVGRVLADTDLLGGTGDNAGFIWIKDARGEIIVAETVKIDPGMAFQFETDDNWVYNMHHRKGGVRFLGDKKHIQVANNDDSVTIFWQGHNPQEGLTPEQKVEFLQVLFNSSRYLNTPDVLDLLFYRDGRFNRSDVEQISREDAERYRDQMITWLQLQLEIYGEELAQFKRDYPTQVIRAHYIDHWGELPLPASDETFPIRELFTKLTIIEINEEKTGEKERKEKEELTASSTNPDLPERDSLFETFQRMDRSGGEISLEALFDEETRGQRIRKVLLIGRAGIGKSTICQKIAHDWSSGRLWKDRYRHVYWLPLRELNAFVEEETLLDGKTGDHWLAEAVAHLLLNDKNLTPSVLQQIQADRQRTLILLDGYDEANPRLRQVLTFILDDPELTVLLTSRPGVTQHLHKQMERLVENIGFSEEHIDRYLDSFFSRKEQLAPTTTSSSSSSFSTPIERKEVFLEVIQSNSNIFAVAHVPLQLQMLAILWEREGDHVGFPDTLTGLYTKMIEHLFVWQLRRSGKEMEEADKMHLLVLLGKIGLVALESGKLLIPNRIIRPILEDTDFSEKDLLDSGLIRATGHGVAREYCFLHLTFQEYLIAYAIHSEIKSGESDWVIRHRYLPQYQLVIAFLCGMIYRSDSSDLRKIKSFFRMLHTHPADLRGIYQIGLTLRCLNECPNSALQEWVDQRFHLYEAYWQLFTTSLNQKQRANNLLYGLSSSANPKTQPLYFIKLYPLAFGEGKSRFLRSLEGSVGEDVNDAKKKLEMLIAIATKDLLMGYLKICLDMKLDELVFEITKKISFNQIILLTEVLLGHSYSKVKPIFLDEILSILVRRGAPSQKLEMLSDQVRWIMKRFGKMALDEKKNRWFDELCRLIRVVGSNKEYLDKHPNEPVVKNLSDLLHVFDHERNILSRLVEKVSKEEINELEERILCAFKHNTQLKWNLRELNILVEIYKKMPPDIFNSLLGRIMAELESKSSNYFENFFLYAMIETTDNEGIMLIRRVAFINSVIELLKIQPLMERIDLIVRVFNMIKNDIIAFELLIHNIEIKLVNPRVLNAPHKEMLIQVIKDLYARAPQEEISRIPDVSLISRIPALLEKIEGFKPTGKANPVFESDSCAGDIPRIGELELDYHRTLMFARIPEEIYLWHTHRVPEEGIQGDLILSWPDLLCKDVSVLSHKGASLISSYVEVLELKFDQFPSYFVSNLGVGQNFFREELFIGKSSNSIDRLHAREYPSIGRKLIISSKIMNFSTCNQSLSELDLETHQKFYYGFKLQILSEIYVNIKQISTRDLVEIWLEPLYNCLISFMNHRTEDDRQAPCQLVIEMLVYIVEQASKEIPIERLTSISDSLKKIHYERLEGFNTSQVACALFQLLVLSSTIQAMELVCMFREFPNFREKFLKTLCLGVSIGSFVQDVDLLILFYELPEYREILLTKANARQCIRMLIACSECEGGGGASALPQYTLVEGTKPPKLYALEKITPSPDDIRLIFTHLIKKLMYIEGPLYASLQDTPPSLCWLESGHEVNEQLSLELLTYFQKFMLENHPLLAYVSSYCSPHGRDLIPLSRWLTQRSGAGWKVNLSKNREEILIVREDGNLDLLIAVQSALNVWLDESGVDGLAFHRKNTEGKLVIQGTKEEIDEFLDNLEEEYRRSRPASSVSSDPIEHSSSSSLPIGSTPPVLESHEKYWGTGASLSGEPSKPAPSSSLGAVSSSTPIPVASNRRTEPAGVHPSSNFDNSGRGGPASRSARGRVSRGAGHQHPSRSPGESSGQRTQPERGRVQRGRESRGKNPSQSEKCSVL